MQRRSGARVQPDRQWPPTSQQLDSRLAPRVECVTQAADVGCFAVDAEYHVASPDGSPGRIGLDDEEATPAVLAEVGDELISNRGGPKAGQALGVALVVPRLALCCP